MKDQKLNVTESSDFHCLLELMLPLYSVDEFAWLPELFSVISHEKLLLLSKYAGGATIRIPTLEELSTAIQALDWYYRVYITRKKRRKSIPQEYLALVDRIREVLDA